MYSTSYKTWARSILIDAAIIGSLVAGIFYGVPHALQVSVFFLWWLSILGIALGILIVLIPVGLQETIETLEFRLELYKGDEAKTKELTKKLEAAELSRKKIWSTKKVNCFAVSHTYLVYHWITDATVWSLLVIADHLVLATFKAASFLITCILIGVARKKYRERLGIKPSDDIEESLPKRQAHVRQVNNVVGGDLVGGDKITK